MTYKQQKQRLQICISLEDQAFLEHFADNTGAKNASMAVHELIYDYKQMKDGIDRLKLKYIEAQQKETYEQVRTEQIKKADEKPGITANKDPYHDPKWSFLGKMEDPNLKSVVKLKTENLNLKTIEKLRRTKK